MTAAEPDFRHVEDWIFDLDNTLYPSVCDLFAQIDARMTEYVSRLLDLPQDTARELQKIYYREHGTTLNGLMRVNGADPDAYLDFVHDIDLSMLAPDPEMQTALKRLPGRKFVFTNGCTNHAGRVLDRLGLAAQFEDVWDIRTIAFRPKPDPAAYRTVIGKAGLDPRASAMFDDVARNLVEARALGMTTVWLKNGSEWSRQGPQHPVAQPHHIDYETEDLPSFLVSVRVAAP